MTKNNFEEIEKYISGEMTDAEKIAFEDKLKANEDLANDFQIRQDFENAVLDEDYLAISKKIKKSFPVHSIEGKRPIILYKNIVRAAVALAIIASLAYIIFHNFDHSNSNPYAISKQYIQEIKFLERPNADVVRNGNLQDLNVSTEDPELKQKLDSFWDSIIENFNLENYSNCLILLESLKAEDPAFKVLSESEFHYFKGIVLMKIGKYQTAANQFGSVTKYYTERSTWYMALCYLNIPGQEEKAKEILIKVNSEGVLHPCKEEAKKVLNALGIHEK